jgi:hypothetical protein
MNVHWAPLYVAPPGTNITNSTDRPYYWTDKNKMIETEEPKKVVAELFIPPELDRKNQNAT